MLIHQTFLFHQSYETDFYKCFSFKHDMLILYKKKQVCKNNTLPRIYKQTQGSQIKSHNRDDILHWLICNGRQHNNVYEYNSMAY